MNQRESSFELLRILAIWGIVCMHCCNSYVSTAQGFSRPFIIGSVVLFNTGVPLFMILSGYFGIKLRAEKLFKLWFTVVTCSFIYLFAKHYIMGAALSPKVLFECATPFSHNKYWFITSYLIIFIFSPYINQVPEQLGRHRFGRLLLVMILVFSLIPILCFAHPLGSHRNVINMLLLYYIGRYIRLFVSNDFNASYLSLAAVGAFLVPFSISLMATYLTKGSSGVGVYFANNSSPFTIALAVAIFLLFRKLHFQSICINYAAVGVLSVYLLEGFPRYYCISHWGHYFAAPYQVPFFLLALSTLIVLFCLGFEKLRGVIFYPVEHLLLKGVIKVEKLVSEKLSSSGRGN